ncbi:hypothetical protein [Dyella lutea]|uniref:Uncharacterized protein n=1 Tax=Dyella lutea TaxID=2950441 RepID=A0ABT1FBI1_9GAMM|nr:hypothetical protein [Dyella lutea]MCP1374722.1 hypothetical protein [Dyella lutea]
MSFTRYLKVLLCLVAAVASGFVAVAGLVRRAVPGLGQAAIVAGDMYRSSAQASQFWFLIVLWSAACAGFAWLAWCIYRS